MGETKEHLKKFSELAKKIAALGESLRQAEKDMKSTWVDQIEIRDLKNVKEQMKAVEETLYLLQEEVGHVEAEHCKRDKEMH